MNSGSLISTFKSPEDSATAGVLALLLEVSGTPKSGNVDRDHDLPDLRYEHFLASASSVFPVFLKASKREGSIGELVLEAVRRSIEWQTAKNVHFGCFMLIIPLLRNWDAEDIGAVVEDLKETSVEDSLAVLRAFRLSEARVMDVKDMSLEDAEVERRLIEEGMGLYEWLRYSPKENVVAMELLEGYPRSLKGKDIILDFFAEYEDVNLTIVYVYHRLLAEHLDPLIIAKHGLSVAKEVRRRAEDVVKKFESTLNMEILRRFDEKLIKRGINPGSIADLTASSIYLALKEGWRF